MGAVYCSADELKEQSFEGLKNADPALLLKLAEAASRFFDRLAEVPSGFFGAAPVYPAWAAATEIAQGAKISPGNGRIYEAVVGGVSGALLPVWPIIQGDSVQDNAITWTDRGKKALEKVFVGDGTDYLYLPPYVRGTLGAVILPDTALAVNFVELFQEEGSALIFQHYPSVNLSLMDATGWAYRTDAWGGRPYFGWPIGIAITVEAEWGFAATPADVRQATIQIAVMAYRANDPALAAAADIESQVARGDIPPMADRIAAKWRERAILSAN